MKAAIRARYGRKISVIVGSGSRSSASHGSQLFLTHKITSHRHSNHHHPSHRRPSRRSNSTAAEAEEAVDSSSSRRPNHRRRPNHPPHRDGPGLGKI